VPATSADAEVELDELDELGQRFSTSSVPVVVGTEETAIDQ
jgi:hypothetical protein